MADSLHQNFPHLFPDDMALENSVFDEPIGGQPAFSVENFEVGGEDFHQEFSQHPMDTSAGFFSDSFGDADLYTRDAMNEQNWSLDASQFGLHDDVSSRVAEPLSGLLEPEHRQEHVTQEPQREMMVRILCSRHNLL